MKVKAKLIVSKEDKFLVLKKKGEKCKYGFLGGNVKKTESPKRGALREAYEEGGVVVDNKHVHFLISVIERHKKEYYTTHYFITSSVETFKLGEPHKFDDILWLTKHQIENYIGKQDCEVLYFLTNTSDYKSINKW